MVWLQLKGEQLSGSAYYFNGCKALMFSSVAHFNQATRQLSTWVKASVSSIRSKDDWGSSCSGFHRAAGAAAAVPKSSANKRSRLRRKKKKKTGVNWIRLCRGNPRPDQEKKKKKRRRKRKKNYSKMPGFARARGRKDRCLISFSVRAAGLRGVDLWGGRLPVFAFCQSVCVCAEKYFWLLFFFFPLSQTERSVINISRLSKQKQTIKPTSRIKVWKQSLYFPSLSYFSGPSQAIPRRAFHLCKHSFSLFDRGRIICHDAPLLRA